MKLFLTLLDLPFTTIELNMKAGDNRKPAHLALNPFGEVPVIEDGDVVMTDSNAILVYLARKYGDASWLPDDPVGAAAVQRWLSLAAGKIAYGPCAARLVTVFGAPRDHASAKKIAEDLFAIIEPEFRDKPFAVGQTPTIADIAAYSYIAHAPEGGISLEPYPAFARVAEARRSAAAFPADAREQGRPARRDRRSTSSGSTLHIRYR